MNFWWAMPTLLSPPYGLIIHDAGGSWEQACKRGPRTKLESGNFARCG